MVRQGTWAELVNKVRADAGPRGGQTMTQRDGASPGVELLHVDAQLLLAGQGLCAEGLVNFNLQEMDSFDLFKLD